LLCVGQLRNGRHSHNIAESDSEVLSGSLVHADLDVLGSGVLRCESNADGLLLLFSFEEDLVAPHQVQLLHLLLCHLDDRVVIVLRVLNRQLVSSFLLLKNRSGKVFLICHSNYIRGVRK